MYYANPNVAKVASLVSEASRAALLTALMDGRLHPASELACIVRIKPQTASFHLSKMVDANIVTVEKQGRHRYYGIRSQEVAQIMESFFTVAPPIPSQSLKQTLEDQAIRLARTCYDHLAGSLGVQVSDALINKGFMYKEGHSFKVTEKGERFFKNFHIDLENVKKKRRSFSHVCLDWSERRYHLAGALGNALLKGFFELDWIRRVPNTRAVKITDSGKSGLKQLLSIEWINGPENSQYSHKHR